ncbi:alpha/beta hydrolase [Flavobacterium luteum]|uniref:Alpha/beta hydrolase n=1 Tax=Flavobacterium luteum TaxID=2026654 RepID=A0A7J5AC22_9FLAO|nr:alpha/beta hydrolase [Flavobacterium luteum]KAB1155080.1 alpha/beta hydrolase [Flavobacterium luteum]
MKKIKFFILVKSIGFYLNILSYVNPRRAYVIAYQFFSEPRKGKLVKEKLPKFLQNATTEIIGHNNHQIQMYKWIGNENVILLVHGWESNASRWKKIMPYLKQTGSTIIAIDAPAHGLSSGKEFNVPQYAEFIHATIQKYNPKTIIAHSIGGAASAFYLHKYPNSNLEKVVLLGSPSEMKIIIDNYIKLLSLNSKISTNLRKQSEDRFNVKIDAFSVHLYSKKFTQKVFIAHDSNDQVVHVKEGLKISKSWTNAIYTQTQGLGHSLHDEKLYSQIVTFLLEA